MRRQSRNQPGQSLVELAVLLPLLLLMIMAMTDYALAFTTHNRLRNAVAEGAYVAAQNPGDLALVRAQIHAALNDLNPPVDDDDITINQCVRVGSNYETEITVRYDRPMMFGLFGVGASVELWNSSTVPQFGACS